MNNACRRLSILRSILFVLLLAVLGGVPAASAQSVDAVISKMKEQYQQQLENVDTYIIETDAYTSYHRKVERDGGTTYETQIQWGEHEDMLGDAGSAPTLHPGLAQLDTLAQHSTYLGSETVDGQDTHVLLVDDPTVFSDEPEMASDDIEGEMKMYIDADRYVPLRMEYELEVDQGGQMQTMTPRVDFSDYRTVDGLTLPWKMEMTMDNLDAAISPEEREEARRSIEEMEARMEEMPEEQRKMMEGAMENQLKQMRSMIEEGSIEFAVEVQDVRVNAPIPDGVFSND